MDLPNTCRETFLPALLLISEAPAVTEFPYKALALTASVKDQETKAKVELEL
jgi:hypothetical protein